MKHLFLIGMPGCGKSYFGRYFSRLLQRPYVDLDHYLEEIYGQSITELLTAGEADFRKKEQAALLKLLTSLNTPAVLAMGGGTPAFNDNIMIMKAHGGLLWLDIPIPTLAKRLLSQPEQRPLLANLSGSALEKKLGEMYQKRSPYYQQANWKINTITPASLDTFVNHFNEFLLQDHG